MNQLVIRHGLHNGNVAIARIRVQRITLVAIDICYAVRLIRRALPPCAAVREIAAIIWRDYRSKKRIEQSPCLIDDETVAVRAEISNGNDVRAIRAGERILHQIIVCRIV